MAWIEYHTALRDHWKIKKFAAILGTEYITALGAVSCLWLWASEYAPTGDISRFTDDILRDAMRCNSEKCTSKALKCAELIDESGKINDWNEYGIRLLKSSRKRQKKHRELSRNGNVTVTSFSLSILSDLSILSNIKQFCEDPAFLKTFQDYLDMRKKIRKPATRRAVELICAQLDKYDLKTAMAMLEQSIVNSWQGIFPLRDQATAAKGSPKQDWDLLIAKELGKIATKENIKAVMRKMPQQLWWKVDRFLKKTYTDSGRSFSEVERELTAEINEHKEKVGGAE